ncbi:hypothetical protein [Paraburkholderia sp. RL17-373-BIF-A]|uniref:hypothetical protein n=1 Tax=Paraburkholderia sp. RL17-373-BIF-A TaxID=3031629 RepID=UPI0038BBAD5D
MVNTSAPGYSYEIKPRPASLGGGWRLLLLEDGTEVGGGVFPVDAEADPQAGLDWWSRITGSERGHWLAKAGSAWPRDAWDAYLQQCAHDDALHEAMSWLESRGSQ